MWKVIVSASAAAALTIALVVTLHDDHTRSDRPPDETRDETAEPSHVETTGATVPSTSATASASADTPAAPAASATGTTSTTTTTTSTTSTGASLDAADGGALEASTPTGKTMTVAPLVTAPPASATPPNAAPPAAAPPADSSIDGGVPTDASATVTAPEESTHEATAPDAGDAGPRDPFAPPSMSAGAGPFATQAPYWGASAFDWNPDAGAGRFSTEAPPWSASAMTFDPNAGAGPFTTEWNIPAFGVWPYWAFGPVVGR